MKGEFYKMEYRAWDIGTVDLTLEQQGAYLRLCHAMYNVQGPIPESTRLLKGILGCGNVKAVALVAQLVKAGKIQRTDGGMLTNRRVEIELAARARLSEVRRGAGGENGRARRGAATERGGDQRVTPECGSSEPRVTPECGSSEPQVIPSNSLTNNDSIEAIASTVHARGDKRREDTPIVPKGTDEGFERFRAAYPKRSTTFPTTQARKRYAEVIKRGASPREIEAGARAYAAEQTRLGNTGGKFVQNADAWLHQNRWLDYVAAPVGDVPEDTTQLLAITDNAWRERVVRWKRNCGQWPWKRCEPPDHPRTNVPAHILGEFGIRHTATPLPEERKIAA
ncbi:DUF1376 domain-containing protein [Methylobacterium sp. J-090]|uniref:DUF1376 domain-containing protein n=1 Tax=Methylobacterium sp. J-090 TaxID=2836666 RepID=UPI001FB8E3F8|nr:DUF1376 domain-containing protein [Methylobacterium sp. J-090]MCJ2080155.1 YdaU family protein [Methylobacterium sp. J-090]